MLTVAILTKNEEKNIVEVIDNAHKVSDKVLIVDSGSTDKTVELAKENGAKVVYRAWDNDFAAQRNFALEHVQTEWILYLDADERINDELAETIKKVMYRKETKQYSIVRKVHAFGFEYKYGIFKPDEVLRLFPSKKVRWINKVHEKPVCELPKEKLYGNIEHYTYVDWQHWLDKASQYTSIWAKDKYHQGKRMAVASSFVHAFYHFLNAYIIRLGFIDGWAGLYSSLQHSIYTLMKYQKLYELQQKSE